METIQYRCRNGFDLRFGIGKARPLVPARRIDV